MICVVCNNPFPQNRNQKTCSMVCKRKLAAIRQARYIKNEKAPWEPSDKELRTEFPYFYSLAKEIVWGKREKRKCMKCQKESLMTNGRRICHVCRNISYGVLAQ